MGGFLSYIKKLNVKNTKKTTNNEKHDHVHDINVVLMESGGVDAFTCVYPVYKSKIQ